jgi:hypothetical protein
MPKDMLSSVRLPGMRPHRHTLNWTLAKPCSRHITRSVGI